MSCCYTVRNCRSIITSLTWGLLSCIQALLFSSASHTANLAFEGLSDASGPGSGATITA